MLRKALADISIPKQHSSEDSRQYSYRVIKNHIISFTLLPGQKLNEQTFASALHVSRTPVHDSFSRLSREKLVEIIPQRGAFVSRLDEVHISNALWTHSILGINALHSIFIKNVEKNNLEVLCESLCKAKDCLEHNVLTALSSAICHYYSQLYALAGDMNLIWDALERTDGDLQRLLTLSVSNPQAAQTLLSDLSAITVSLQQRDCDAACRSYERHLGRLSEAVCSFKQLYPDYFTV